MNNENRANVDGIRVCSITLPFAQKPLKITTAKARRGAGLGGFKTPKLGDLSPNISPTCISLFADIRGMGLDDIFNRRKHDKT